MRVRRLIVALLVVFALASCAAAQDSDAQKAQHKQPLVLKPDLPTTQSNHRLILKDGSFQLCRRYEIVGERVRYLSIERGDWEELPVSLVDWDVTRKWEKAHADMGEEQSPGMKEAAEVDKEEAESRAALAARTPEIEPGLELPDQDGVFALDTFIGKSQLVEIEPHSTDVSVKEKHGVPIVKALGQSAHIELDGTHAKVHLHVDDPIFYLSLDTRDDAENVIQNALVVNTGGAKESRSAKHGAQSLKSGFYVVHIDERKTVRILGVLHQSAGGKISEEADAIHLKAEPMKGKLWLKLTPEEKLEVGEYALVEMLPDGAGMSATVWDFRVDPRMGENPGAYGAIEREKN